jgi:hypothetical protein
VSIQLDKLRQALAFTETMAAQAAQGNWEMLVELEERRALALEQAFALPSVAAEREMQMELIRCIQRWDNQTVINARALRDAARDELEQLRRGQRAVKAYGR